MRLLCFTYTHYIMAEKTHQNAVFQALCDGDPVSDAAFDRGYKSALRTVSEFHFTPVLVAQKAAQYLVARPGCRVLDVGSGTGKFCLVGAACTLGIFVGVEQRLSLHVVAEYWQKKGSWPRVEFLNLDVKTVSFLDFDAIYYYNSFYEHIYQDSAIDQSLPLSSEAYWQNVGFMRASLDEMPKGTKLATYFSFLDEIPDSFQLQSTDFDQKLKLWEKMR